MNDSFYKTSDQAFSAYLGHEGFTFLGAVNDPTDSHPDQKSFVFIDQPKERGALEEAFRTGRGDNVSAKRFSYWMRKVYKAKLNAVDPKEIANG